MAARSRSWRPGPTLLTVTNVNSPRRVDAEILDCIMVLARHGQCVVITPFTLMGAMAPITLAGALVQQTAEALGVITLLQLVRPGAPCVMGGFTSNVDMRTGSPAFGTPEYVHAVIASAQIGRRLKLPVRTQRGQRLSGRGRPVHLRDRLLAAGGDPQPQSPDQSCRGWLEGGPDRFARERSWSTPNCCATGRRSSSRSSSTTTTWGSRPSRTSRSAVTSSVRRTRWPATRRRSIGPCCPTGRTSRTGPTRVRATRRKGRPPCGKSCWPSTCRRRSILRSRKPSTAYVARRTAEIERDA